MASKSAASWAVFGVVAAGLFGLFVLLRGGIATAPQIEAAFPPRVSAGDVVVVIGEGFSPAAAENIVTLDGTPQEVLQSGPHYIVAGIDPQAKSGRLAVTVKNKQSNALSVEIVPLHAGMTKQVDGKGAPVEQGGMDAMMGKGAGDESPVHQFFSGADAKPAPEFSLPDHKGVNHTLAELKGRTVLVNFWASWCPPCIEEIPSLLQLQKNMPKDKFIVVAVTQDTKWEDAAKAINPEEAGIMVLMDDNSATAKSYGTAKYPETYVVNGEGKIVAKFIGSRNWGSPLFRNFFEQMAAPGAPQSPHGAQGPQAPVEEEE